MTLTEVAPQTQLEKRAPSVGVLVTNYNSWELARACIEASLELHPHGLERVVLLDDASPEPPPFEAGEGWELIRNPQNLGFARNLNQGVRMMNTDIVLLFDADAKPLKPYLDIIQREFMADSRLALLGFSTVDEQGRPTPSWNREPNLWSLVLGQALYVRLAARLEKRETRICPWLCALAVRREAFEELNGFDEEFDLLDVDIDLGMRVHRSKWTLKSMPELLAFHTGGGTPMLLSSRLLRFYANRWRTLTKHRKMRFPKLCKAAILARLRVELLILQFAGRRAYKNPEVLRDKLEGRRKLIRYCAENY